MRLIPVFFWRRMWILSHHWLGELALGLLLPVGIYFSVALSLNNVIRVSPDGIPFLDWIQPGLIFVIVLINSYFPIYIEIFENRKLHPFLETITASPNSSSAIVLALMVSLLPDVILKSLLAGIIFQLLSGSIMNFVPFFVFIFFIAILSCLVINLAITLSLLAKRPSHFLFSTFLIFLFIIFSSGWMIPLDFLPSTLYIPFSFLPTTQLLEGGRQILFHNKYTIFTWLVPVVISSIWLILNSVIFKKVNTL